jgi:hypothetical protein
MWGIMANKNPILPESNVGKKYNRTVQDPRVALFKQYYTDIKSETFCNIRGSAMRAGFSESYSDNISNNKPTWWVEFIESGEKRRAEMLDLSESNMRRVLGAIPEDKDAEKLQIQVSQFVSERVGKEFYSTRTELTDKGGRRLFRGEDRDARKIELGSLFKGVESAPGEAK